MVEWSQLLQQTTGTFPASARGVKMHCGQVSAVHTVEQCTVDMAQGALLGRIKLAPTCTHWPMQYMASARFAVHTLAR